MVSGLERLSSSNDFADKCGGMADIFKRNYNGSTVALKVLRPFKLRASDPRQSRKASTIFG